MYIFLIKKLHQNMNKLEILSFNLQLNALKEIKRNYKSLKTKIKKLND
jgi:hypothetical protein